MILNIAFLFFLYTRLIVSWKAIASLKFSIYIFLQQKSIWKEIKCLKYRWCQKWRLKNTSLGRSTCFHVMVKLLYRLITLLLVGMVLDMKCAWLYSKCFPVIYRLSISPLGCHRSPNICWNTWGNHVFLFFLIYIKDITFMFYATVSI